jgi:hypothetical protein
MRREAVSSLRGLRSRAAVPWEHPAGRSRVLERATTSAHARGGRRRAAWWRRRGERLDPLGDHATPRATSWGTPRVEDPRQGAEEVVPAACVVGRTAAAVKRRNPTHVPRACARVECWEVAEPNGVLAYTLRPARRRVPRHGQTSRVAAATSAPGTTSLPCAGRQLAQALRCVGEQVAPDRAGPLSAAGESPPFRRPPEPRACVRPAATLRCRPDQVRRHGARQRASTSSHRPPTGLLGWSAAIETEPSR